MDLSVSIAFGLVGLCLLVVAVLILRAAPRAAFVLWAIVLFFVPVWVGVSLGGSFSVAAITAMTLVALVALGKNLRLSIVDLAMGFLVLLIVGQYALGLVGLASMTTALIEWLVPYAWGRLVLSRVPSSFVIQCLAVCATVAAALAIIEFVSGTNLFVLIPLRGPSYSTWGPLQIRAGILRAEGAWGHSIALGAALGMSAPFVLSAPWKPVPRLLAVVAVAVGTVLTLSRIGMITLALALALSILRLPGIGRMARLATGGMGVIGALIIVPTMSTVLSDAGQEAERSANYRGTIFSLFDYVNIVGSAPSFRGVTAGGIYLGSFANSIDNTFLLTGLRYGWLALAAFCSILAIVAVSVFLPHQANPASVAVAAQVPGLFAVALITQFGMYFWFLVGLAVAWSAAIRQRPGPEVFAREETPSGKNVPMSLEGARASLQ